MMMRQERALLPGEERCAPFECHGSCGRIIETRYPGHCLEDQLHCIVCLEEIAKKRGYRGAADFVYQTSPEYKKEREQ